MVESPRSLLLIILKYRQQLTREKAMMYTTIFSLTLGLFAACGLQAANPEAGEDILMAGFPGLQERAL